MKHTVSCLLRKERYYLVASWHITETECILLYEAQYTRFDVNEGKHLYELPKNMCNIFCNHFSYTYTTMYWSWQKVAGYYGKRHADMGQVPANSILFCFPFIPSFSFFNHKKGWRTNSNVSTIKNLCIKKKIHGG